jgi:hypothetical protein
VGPLQGLWVVKEVSGHASVSASLRLCHSVENVVAQVDFVEQCVKCGTPLQGLWVANEVLCEPIR